MNVEKEKKFEYIEFPLWCAGVAELADALDSKSSGPKGPCGFDSLLRHTLFPRYFNVLRAPLTLFCLSTLRQFWPNNFSAFKPVLAQFGHKANTRERVCRRTHDSGSCNQGSNPCFPATLIFSFLPVKPFFVFQFWYRSFSTFQLILSHIWHTGRRLS